MPFCNCPSRREAKAIRNHYKHAQFNQYTSLNVITYIKLGSKWWISAQNAIPFRQLVVKFVTLTPVYAFVISLHHSNRSCPGVVSFCWAFGVSTFSFKSNGFSFKLTFFSFIGGLVGTVSFSISSSKQSNLSSISEHFSEYISLSVSRKSLRFGGGIDDDLTSFDFSLIGENVSAVGVLSSRESDCILLTRKQGKYVERSK